LAFSLFEDLRQSRAMLSWSRAESQDLRRQLRKEQMHTRRAQSSPEALLGIAHDFSNLLETVSAAATMLQPGHPESMPYHDALEAALSQARSLISTLQDWTDREREEIMPDEKAVELNEIAREVLDASLLPLRAPRIRVRLQLDGLPAISANRLLIMRVLSNLVWNAVEAMPDGGLLNLLGYVQRNRVVLEISDTGVGISKREQEKIFKTDYSTKEGHAGMGLLLVYQLVRRAGGDISFVSHPGRGSAFALSFPIARPDAVKISSEAAHAR
jgi:signal transduction histidine kinase